MAFTKFSFYFPELPSAVQGILAESTGYSEAASWCLLLMSNSIIFTLFENRLKKPNKTPRAVNQHREALAVELKLL